MGLSAAKYFPSDFELPAQVGIFNDRIDLSTPGQNPYTFVIRNKDIAQGFKEYFEYFWNQDVIVDVGVKAFERVFLNMLDELSPGEEYRVIGTASTITTMVKFYDNFHNIRIKKGIILKMLTHERFYQTVVDRNHRFGDPSGKVSFVKRMFSGAQSPIQINVYHNKCFIVIDAKEPTMISINKPEVAEGFKNYFDEMWKNAK